MTVSLVKSPAVYTWADGFGIWHASVKGTPTMTGRATAYRAIRDEIAARQGVAVGGLMVAYVETSNGRTTYREA